MGLKCSLDIAQEVMEVVPELVVYSEELDVYNMNYGPMVSMLTEAVKEHHAKTVAQQAEIDTLKEHTLNLRRSLWLTKSKTGKEIRKLLELLRTKHWLEKRKNGVSLDDLIELMFCSSANY